MTSAAPGAKEEPFRSLVRLLAVHEAVEEEIVHPYVKRRVGAAADVGGLLDEEREIKKMLVALDALGPAGSGFDALFDQFQTTLLAHAGKEEKGESAWPPPWPRRTRTRVWSPAPAACWWGRRWR